MILDGIEWRRFKQVTNWCASDTSVFSDDGFSCVAEPDRCLLSCLKETITLAAAISRQAGLQLDRFAGHSKQEQQCLLQAAHIYTFIYLCDFFFFSKVFSGHEFRLVPQNDLWIVLCCTLQHRKQVTSIMCNTG